MLLPVMDLTSKNISIVDADPIITGNQMVKSNNGIFMPKIW
jgi:hypothetical protein